MNDQNERFTLEIQTTDKKRKRVKSAYGLTDIILRI